MLQSKWTLFLLAVVGVLLLLYFLGRKSVHSQILISATPQEVWSVLIDTPKYSEWNPVLIPIEGQLKEGEKVTYEFRQDENTKSKIPSKVKKMIPNKLLNQGGGMNGIITFDHRYILEEINGQTKVTIHEDYQGIYVNFWNATPVEHAYVKLNKALKNRVETIAK